eukprot:3573898-Rhodomonas_salina.1
MAQHEQLQCVATKRCGVCLPRCGGSEGPVQCGGVRGEKEHGMHWEAKRLGKKRRELRGCE